MGNKIKWKKLIFPIICFVVVIALIFSMNDITEVFETLKNVNFGYLSIGIVLLIVYFLLWPISLCILSFAKKCNISFKNVFLIGSTEHFFNGITPFATGGQPFEVYAFKKKNVSLSDSTGVLLMNFVLYQTAITVLSIVSLIIYYGYLKTNIPNLRILMIIGVTINVLILLMFIFLGTLKSFRRLLLNIMKLFAKIKFLKKVLTPKIESFDFYCRDFQLAFREIFEHKVSFVFALIVKFITLIIYYIIPYFVIKSVGGDINSSDILFVGCMTSFSICMTCFLPTPGASGGIEFAFKTLFATVVTTIQAVSGMLVWRFLTYYFMMILSLVALFIFNKITKKEEQV